MSEKVLNQKEISMLDDNKIILAPERSEVQRYLAFSAILVIYFFYCYNFMVGTFVKPTMIYTLAEGGFGFTLKQTEVIFSIMSFATIPGTLFFGWMSSKLGKKNTLMIVALWISAATFLPMMMPLNYRVWQIARFVTGFALGGVFGTAVPLVTEMFKQKHRGKLAAILTSTFSIAMIFGGKMYGVFGDEGWKILMYTAIIPPIIGAVLTYFLVPSDYEYVKNLNANAREKGERINYLSMYKGKYLWIGIGVILLSGANFTAYSSFSNNATTYLKTVLGLSAATAGSIYSLQGWGQLIGYNMWGYISDKVGRKIPAIGMALSAVAVFMYLQLGSEDVNSFKMVSVLIGLCVGFSGAWGAYYTELFPKRFSALAPGISFNGGRIISMTVLPTIAGIGATSAGMPGIFMVSMLVFAAGAVVWFLLPETLNRVRED